MKNLLLQGALRRKLFYPQRKVSVTSAETVVENCELQSPSKAAKRLLILQHFAACFVMLFVLGVGNTWAAGTETFENIANSSGTSYTNRSWTGDNGAASWAATNARIDQKISGNRGLCFKASTASTITMKLTSAQQTAGMGVLSFKYKFPYSDSGKSRVLSITIGSNTYSSGTLNYGSNSSYDGSITVNSALASGTVTINVNTGGARICVDDFSWTSYSASTSVSLTAAVASGNGSILLAAHFSPFSTTFI